MIIPYLTQANSPFLSKNNTGLGNAIQIFTSIRISKKFNVTFNNYYIVNLLIKLNPNLNLKCYFKNLQTFSL